MERLSVILAGQGPDLSLRLKTMSYAPFAFKAYLDRHFGKRVRTRALDFGWEVDSARMASRILSEEPDLVGFSVYLWNYANILECARRIKNHKEDILIVIGGPQVSPIAEEVIHENPSVDIISYAPAHGETILLDIVESVLQGKDLNTAGGIYYRDNNGNIVRTSSEVKPLNYETTPSPYVSRDSLFEGDAEYMAVIEGSRGCPFDCGYCFWGHGKRNIEYFPIQRVLEDIEVVYNNPKVKHLYFADSNLLSDTERAETIIKHMIRQKREVSVDFEINCIYLKESTAKLMASLPDFQFILSIQSANPNALRYIGKGRATSEVFIRTVNNLKRWVPGVKYKFDIMLGLPGDDINGFMQTLDFVLSLEPFYIVLSYPLYLLPGSRFFENKETWALKYSPSPPYSVIETPTFPKKEIEKAVRIALWVQILTYYYPAIGRFFYSIARQDGMRMPRLLRWIEAIDKRVGLFEDYGNLTDVATGSVAEWNLLKKNILENSSAAKNGRIIYSTICELEDSFIGNGMGGRIPLGRSIFEYLTQQKADAVEFSSLETLPPDITNDTNPAELKELFSVYKR